MHIIYATGLSLNPKWEEWFVLLTHFTRKNATLKYDEQMSYLCDIIEMAGRSPLANCSPMRPG